MSQCRVEGCEAEVGKKGGAKLGLCTNHYQHHWRLANGKSKTPFPPLRNGGPPEEPRRIPQRTHGPRRVVRLERRTKRQPSGKLIKKTATTYVLSDARYAKATHGKPIIVVLECGHAIKTIHSATAGRERAHCYLCSLEARKQAKFQAEEKLRLRTQHAAEMKEKRRAHAAWMRARKAQLEAGDDIAAEQHETPPSIPTPVLDRLLAMQESIAERLAELGDRMTKLEDIATAPAPKGQTQTDDERQLELVSREG